MLLGCVCLQAAPDLSNTTAISGVGSTAVHPSNIQGQAVIHAVGPDSSVDLQDQALSAWKQQRFFAFSFVLSAYQHGHSNVTSTACHDCAPGSDVFTATHHTGPSSGSSSRSSGNSGSSSSGQRKRPAPVPDTIQEPRGSSAHDKAQWATALQQLPAPAALAVCWGDREVLLLAMSPPCGAHHSSQLSASASLAASGSEVASSSSAANSYAARVWETLQEVFGDPTKTAVCCSARHALAVLHAQVVPCRLQLHDPLAGFSLWQSAVNGSRGDTDGLLLSAQQRLLTGYNMHTPMQYAKDTSLAVRQALLGRVLHTPMQSVLAHHHLSDAYQDVGWPLECAVADIKVTGWGLSCHGLAAMISHAQQWRQALMGHLNHLLGRQCVSSLREGEVLSIVKQTGLAPPRQDSNDPATAGGGDGSVEQLLSDALRAAVKLRRLPAVQLLTLLLTYCRVGLLTDKASQLLGLAGSAHTLRQPGSVLSIYPPVGQLTSEQAAEAAPQSASTPTSNSQTVADCILSDVSLPSLPLTVCCSSVSGEICSNPGGLPLTSPQPVVLIMQQSHHQHNIPVSSAATGLFAMLVDVQCVHSRGMGTVTTVHGSSTSYMGHIRYWHGGTRAMREDMQPCSLLYRVVHHHGPPRMTGGDQNAMLVYASATISLRHCVVPHLPATMYVGVMFPHLHLQLLSMLSYDSQLTAACAQAQPLDAAASHWLGCCSKNAVALRLLAAAKQGAEATADSATQQFATPAALLSAIITALVEGHSARQLADAVCASDRSAGAALLESLSAAFPGLLAMRSRVMSEASKTG